jgi:hypothetical protein
MSAAVKMLSEDKKLYVAIGDAILSGTSRKFWITRPFGLSVVLTLAL